MIQIGPLFLSHLGYSSNRLDSFLRTSEEKKHKIYLTSNVFV